MCGEGQYMKEDNTCGDCLERIVLYVQAHQFQNVNFVNMGSKESQMVNVVKSSIIQFVNIFY